MAPTPADPERQEDARAAFQRWASLQTGCPRDVGSLVQGVECSDDHVGLLTTDVQGRRVVWKAVPCPRKERVSCPGIGIESVDAWNADAGVLRERSDHVAMCGVCGGEGKVHCGPCGGVGKTICVACGGQRKIYGYAANGARRLLNCSSCRGKGEVDCADCRRGIAVCAVCGGEGRMQRWIEIEWWRRAVANEHPQWIARQFGWDANPTNDVIRCDADVVIDIDKPHRLTAIDVGNVPAPWLEQLAPTLEPGERIVRQRLRIARVPTHTVRYRLGGEEDGVAFTGRRLIAPPANALSAFSRRASSLRSLRRLLLLTFCVSVLLSQVRGAFYWSVPTLLSIAAWGAALAAVYGGAAQWTAARRQTHRWLLATTSCVAVAIALAFAALPRVNHVDRLLAAGKLDAADRELNALGDGADARIWADLRLARIHQATDVVDARNALAQIPRALPQHAIGLAAVDGLILRKTAEDVRQERWSEAAAGLALVSVTARGEPESVATATAVYLTLARRKIASNDWSGAADAIFAARNLGVASADLDVLAEAIRTASVDAAASAKRENDAGRRLRLRLAAEQTLVSWERASGKWGTPLLIALRTSMARDVATLEKAARRRRAS